MTRGQARKPRPLCAQCQRKPVKQLRCRFCSSTCAGLAKMKARRLCAWCKVEPLKRTHGYYRFCSRSCAAMARRSIQLPLLRAGWQKAMETQRAKYFARVNALIGLQVEALLEHLGVPLEQRPAARKHLIAVVKELYRRAYSLGYHCARNRFQRGKAA